MSDPEIESLTRHIAEELIEHFTIGIWGLPFCDEPADFEESTAEEIAVVIKRVFSSHRLHIDNAPTE